MPERFAQIDPATNMMGGYLDLPIITEALKTGADFVWACEYDVDWSGNWADFFQCFSNNDADLLTTTVRTYDQSREWHYWSNAVAPPEVSREQWLRAFHPIMRLSRPLMERYAEEMTHPGWAGHYEFLLPTIALQFDFKVEDLGGEGPFCPAERRGQLYSNTPHEWLLAPGTFVWRPSLDHYSWQEGAAMEPNKLYHPVKTGVAEWEIVRKRDEAAFHALRHHLKSGQLKPAVKAAFTVSPSYLSSRVAAKLRRRRRL